MEIIACELAGYKRYERRSFVNKAKKYWEHAAVTDLIRDMAPCGSSLDVGTQTL
jgi:hypothetical protein